MARIKTMLDMETGELIGYGLLSVPVVVGYASALWTCLRYLASIGQAFAEAVLLLPA